MPRASRRMPHSGSSTSSTSAIRLLAVGEHDVDAGVVLRETADLNAVVDRHPQLVDPAGQDALDVVLPQPEPVGMPGGKVADVKRGPGECRDLRYLSLGQEPIGDSTLIEDLDCA